MLSAPIKNVFRICAGFLVLGWIWKAPYFAKLLDAYWRAPVHHDLFPSVFEAPYIAALFYALPLIVLPFCLYKPTRSTCLFGATLLCVSSAVCTLHIVFYNDATFTTAFWVSLWLLWLAWNFESHDTDLLVQAQWLARGTIFIFFFAGAVGKLTPSYWSGEVLHDIYFLQKDYPPYVFLYDTLSEDALRELATWFSRFTIVAEAAIAAMVFLPFERFAPVAIAMMLGMVMGSTPYLFSVMGAPVGMLLAIFFWTRRAPIVEQPL